MAALAFFSESETNNNKQCKAPLNQIITNVHLYNRLELKGRGY